MPGLLNFLGNINFGPLTLDQWVKAGLDPQLHVSKGDAGASSPYYNVSSTVFGAEPAPELPSAKSNPLLAITNTYFDPNMPKEQKATIINSAIDNTPGLSTGGLAEAIGVDVSVIDNWLNRNLPQYGDPKSTGDDPFGGYQPPTDTTGGGGGGSDAGGGATDDLGTDGDLDGSDSPLPGTDTDTGGGLDEDSDEYIYPNEALPGDAQIVDVSTHKNPDGSVIIIETDVDGNTYERWGKYGEDTDAETIQDWYNVYFPNKEGRAPTEEEVKEAADKNNIPWEVVVSALPSVFGSPDTGNGGGSGGGDTGGDTGDGTGDGTGNGNGTGDGTGDGTGNGTGDGNGDGTGDGNGDGLQRLLSVLAMIPSTTQTTDKLFNNEFRLSNKITPKLLEPSKPLTPFRFYK